MDEVSTYNLPPQIPNLTSIVEDYVIALRARRLKLSQPCRICAHVGHLTSQCPTLYEDDQQVHAFGGYYEQPEYDPYHHTYNPDWGDYPDFSYAEANNYQDYQGYQAQPAPLNSTQHL